MKQIKFRAWDKLNARMISHSEILSIELLSKALHFVNELFKGNPTYITDFNLMQYTGLLDKNGVEIYEGDIIETSYFDEQKKKKYARDCVQWNDNTFDYGGRCIGFAFNNYWSYIEVIGNIYENKELLKDKK